MFRHLPNSMAVRGQTTAVIEMMTNVQGNPHPCWCRTVRTLPPGARPGGVVIKHKRKGFPGITRYGLTKYKLLLIITVILSHFHYIFAEMRLAPGARPPNPQHNLPPHVIALAYCSKLASLSKDQSTGLNSFLNASFIQTSQNLFKILLSWGSIKSNTIDIRLPPSSMFPAFAWQLANDTRMP